MTPDRLPALALVVAFVPLSAGCATTAPLAPDSPREVRGESLAPYAMHEVCTKMAAGDRVDWSFTAGAALHFNIHYHEGNAVLMPVSRDGVTSDSGVFRAMLPQEYCLMWEAGAEATALDYRVKLVPARR